MKTRITLRLFFTYFIFFVIILSISLFFFFKIQRINNVFQIGLKEYSIIIKINKIKLKYFIGSDLRFKTKDELKELENEILDIRNTLKELAMQEKDFESFYNNIFKKNLNNTNFYEFINLTEGTLDNLYKLHIKEIEYIKQTIYVLLSLVFIFGFTLMFYFTRNISRPILNLKKIVSRSANEINLDMFDEINTGDEIESLSHEFKKILNIVNVTEKKLKNSNSELEQRLKEKIEEINQINKRIYHTQKLSALGRLVAGIAHEIKNPLNVMTNILYDIKTEDTESMNILKEQIERINRLVSGFLDYARYEKYDMKKINIMESINNVLNFFKMSSKDIEVNLRSEIKYFNVNGDSDKLEQAFLNLLVNSKKALVDRENKKIEVNVSLNNKNINIEFYDNGEGIDEKIMDKIFEPFFTTNQNGNGFGLAIVYNIIKNHEGNIQVNSEKGKYTKFVISFREG